MNADIASSSSSCGGVYKVILGMKRTAVPPKQQRETSLAAISMLFKPEILLRQSIQIARAYGSRKSPLKLAGMLGLSWG
jgi:hypothetical protein